MDNVNSPAHYKRGGMGCIEVIRAICEGLAGVEDLKKARKYLDWLIEQEEKESETKM